MTGTHIALWALLLRGLISTEELAAKGGNAARNSELENRISTLEELVVQLQAQSGANDAHFAVNKTNIVTNAGNITTNTSNIATNAGNITAHQAKLQYVSIVEESLNELAGPRSIIEGANLHVCSGYGSTNDGRNAGDYDCATRTGLGILIIGYKEAREPALGTTPDCG